jgi:hypothetical protein
VLCVQEKEGRLDTNMMHIADLKINARSFMQIFNNFFSDVDNCLIQTSVKVSRKSIDLDCRFRNLECCVCHETVGHQYCKASKKLPHLIGLNAINLSAITMLVFYFNQNVFMKFLNREFGPLSFEYSNEAFRRLIYFGSISFYLTFLFDVNRKKINCLGFDDNIPFVLKSHSKSNFDMLGLLERTCCC